MQAGGDRHRHGQHVVQHQPGGGGQPRAHAQVVPRHQVGPGPVRVRRNGLPVRDPDGDHQQHQPGRQRQGQAQRPAAGEHQHGEQRLRPVRHRAEQVGGEHRQGHQFAHPLVQHRRAGQRGTEDRPADPAQPPGEAGVGAVGRFGGDQPVPPAPAPRLRPEQGDRGQPTEPARGGAAAVAVQGRVDRQGGRDPGPPLRADPAQGVHLGRVERRELGRRGDHGAAAVVVVRAPPRHRPHLPPHSHARTGPVPAVPAESRRTGRPRAVG